MGIVFDNKKTINICGELLDLSTPKVMGILNVTPDSFYDGGNYTKDSDIIKQTEAMLQEGASIIDVGGMSTKPNAEIISEDQEYQRVVPIIKLLIKAFPGIKISIDTNKSSIAEAAIQEGAGLINDVSGGQHDDKIYEVSAKYKVPYILMHMRGDAHTMMSMSNYENMILEIMGYFEKKVKILHTMGIYDVIIDPGFGFSKNIDQNYELLKKMPYFQSLKLPILVGVSRKSMISRKLNVSSTDSLNGTTVLNTVALMQGASLLRVHDVKEAVEAVKLYKAIYPIDAE